MTHIVLSRIANDVNDVNDALFYFLVAWTFRVWVPRNKIKDGRVSSENFLFFLRKFLIFLHSFRRKKSAKISRMFSVIIINDKKDNL